MPIREDRSIHIEGMPPEAYASLWGGDPVYDNPPRQRGDGYLFYNFSSENVRRTREFLDQFAAAIERTVLSVKNHAPKDIAEMSKPEFEAYLKSPDFAEREIERHQSDRDLKGLMKLLIHVRKLQPEAIAA